MPRGAAVLTGPLALLPLLLLLVPFVTAPVLLLLLGRHSSQLLWTAVLLWELVPRVS